MTDRDDVDPTDRFPTRFKKGWKGGPGRPKGVKNGDRKRRSTIKGDVARETDFGPKIEREGVPKPKGKGGRPKGKKNKFSLSAADRMIELGFDPIEQYLDLLDKVRADGNQQLEERILSRLVPFRFAQLHHTMMTDTKDIDLQVKVANFMAPESMGNNGEANVEKSEASDEPLDDAPLAVNVTRFDRKSGG